MPYSTPEDSAEAARILARPGSAPIVTLDGFGREVRREMVDAVAPRPRGVRETTWPYEPGHRWAEDNSTSYFTEEA